MFSRPGEFQNITSPETHRSDGLISDPAQPTAALEIDDKGHTCGSTSPPAAPAISLNNTGVSGVVLIDANKVRRAEVVLDPTGRRKSVDMMGKADRCHKVPKGGSVEGLARSSAQSIEERRPY